MPILYRRRPIFLGSGGGHEFDPERISPEFISRGTAGSQALDGTDVGFTYPTEDVREDDLFIALVAVNDRGATPAVANTASGWTHLTEVTHNELSLDIFYKRATGTETGAVTPFNWSSSDATNDVALCQVFQYRYVDWDNEGPFVGTPTSQTGNLTTLALPTVETQGKNGLAVAACAFSDDLSGNLTSEVSATGGTWIQPRDRDSTTTADDAAVCLYQAPLAEAGTITGGSLSLTGNSPQSSRSISIGFALRGMVDPENYETISVSIAASADDAREATATTAVQVTSQTLFMASQLVGMRFTGLSALAGKTIVQANFQLTASATEGFANNGTILIKGEAADTAAQYTTTNADISNRSTTTAQRNWTVPAFIANSRNIRQRSVDLRSIVQEITDRAGYGGVVAFILSQVASSRQWAAWDHPTLEEATLTVRYLP